MILEILIDFFLTNRDTYRLLIKKVVNNVSHILSNNESHSMLFFFKGEYM